MSAADVPAGGDRVRGIERKRPDEASHPAEQRTRGRVEQHVAPVERRPQRLMTRQRRAQPAGQQVQPVVQPRRDDREPSVATRRGQFDRERQPVEPPADIGDQPHAGFVDRTIRRGRANPFQEQLDGGTTHDLVVARVVVGHHERPCAAPLRPRYAAARGSSRVRAASRRTTSAFRRGSRRGRRCARHCRTRAGSATPRMRRRCPRWRARAACPGQARPRRRSACRRASPRAPAPRTARARASGCAPRGPRVRRGSSCRSRPRRRA